MNNRTTRIIKAGLECGIDIDDIEDAYQGEYSSDEVFARQISEDGGYSYNNEIWPYTCIDWEYATRELMCDYVTHDNLYFRNI